MQTRSIGEMLREERQAHRLDLDELSKKTRIRLKFLQALENNQFEQLPAAVFVKGYIKSYAQVFGFDSQPLIALLRRDFKESAKGRLVPREFIKGTIKGKQYIQPIRLILLTLISLFAILVIYVGVQWYNYNKPPNLTIVSPENESFVSSQIEVKGQTSTEAIVLVNSAPVSLQADGSFITQIYIPREGVTTITIEATDRRGKTNLIQRTVYVKF